MCPFLSVERWCRFVQTQCMQRKRGGERLLRVAVWVWLLGSAVEEALAKVFRE